MTGVQAHSRRNDSDIAQRPDRTKLDVPPGYSIWPPNHIRNVPKGHWAIVFGDQLVGSSRSEEEAAKVARRDYEFRTN